jgi:hypothetical protein
VSRRLRWAIEAAWFRRCQSPTRSSPGGASNSRPGRTPSHSTCTWGHVKPGAFCSPEPQPDRQNMGQDSKGHRVVPPAPPAHLLGAPPHVLLSVLKRGVNGPAPPAQPHPRRQWRRGGGLAPRRLHRAWHDIMSPHQPHRRTGQAFPHRPPRTRAERATMAPWRPALMVRRQGLAGTGAASCATGIGSGSPACRRPRVGGRPWPDPGASPGAGRWAQPRVSWGTSAKDHQPSPATRSGTSGARPQAASPVTPRQRRGLAWCTAASISHPKGGLGLNTVARGTPQRRRRSA